MKHRDDKWKNKLKTHGTAYRRKVRVYGEKVIETYKKTESVELGMYRHNLIHTNYDDVVSSIIEKWEERDPKMALELIHTTQNKCNSMILEYILKADREVR